MEFESDHEALVINSKSHQYLNDDDDIKQKEKKQIIFTLYCIMFSGSVGFSVMMSSMWPFMREIDKTVSETFYGWVNAAFSLAQMMFSFVFGYWCDRRPAMEPLLLSFILMIGGYILYAFAQTYGGLWFLLAGRVLVGCSSGNVAVTRTVGAHLTNNQDRVKVLSYLTMFQTIGFLVGPLFQAATQPIGPTGYYISILKLKLNIYTTPCLIMILLGLLNIVLVLVSFRKLPNEKGLKQKHQQSSDFSPLDKYAVCACVGLWFVTMSVFALNESLISPILMNEYAWSRRQTAFYGALLMSGSGVQCIFLYIAAVPLCKRFMERKVMLFAFILLLLGYCFYLPWGPGKLKLLEIVRVNGTILDNGGGGCPSNYYWCHTSPKLPFPQLLTGIILINTGYPLTVVMINVLYSKVIGPFPQGRYMAWLTGIGSLARVVGPLYITVLYQHYGLRWSATSTIIMLFVTIVFIKGTWKRLLPYSPGDKNTLNC